MRQILLTVLIASVAFAGCVSSDSTDQPGEVDPAWTNERIEITENFMPHGEGHDHADVDSHQFLLNYEVSSHDPLLSNAANMAGLHVIDIQGDYLYGGVWGSHDASSDGGLVIWDISDRLAPVEVGRYVVPGAVGGDRSLEVTQDGNYAVLGIEKATCFGQVNANAAVEAYLFDVSDKTNPIPVDTITATGQSRDSQTNPRAGLGGVHSVTIYNVDGDDYAILFGDVYLINRNVTVSGEAAPAELVKVNTMVVGHDIYIRQTPEGDYWGLTATGDRFFVLYDMNDPTFEDPLGFWDLDTRPDVREGGVTYYFHTADVAFFEDQTIIVQTSEDAGDHLSPFWILDATDPTDIQYLGNWTNPFNVNAEHIIFSQHNPRFSEDGIFTLTHYHGGFVQFDFRHPDFRGDPAIIAYGAVAPQAAPILSDPKDTIVQGQLCGFADSSDPAPGIHIPETMYYMDVALGDDGILYIADVMSGLITFKPTADHPVYGDSWA